MSASVVAYALAYRALWLRSQDVIEIRARHRAKVVEPPQALEVTAHIANFRLLGVSLADNKRLGLGRWLRRQAEVVEQAPADPVPAGVVVYDEAARVAYFSLWPRLDPDRHAENRLQRPGQVYVDGDGALARIRFPVTGRRRQEDELGAAAGFLAER